MKKFTDIEQFRNVIRSLKLHHDFKGYDESEQPIYRHDSPYPTLTFNGTVKLHGTNAGIVLYKDGHIEYQSRERVLSFTSDNAKFMLCMSLVDVKKLFEGIEFTDHVALYGEWCGCFPYGTPILLADGTKMPIGKIVNEKKKVDVLCYNPISQKLESKKIINWYKNGKTDDWINIVVQRRKRGGRSTNIIVTPNHKIFVKENNQIIEKFASEICLHDKVLIAGNKLTYNAKQFLMGTLLGDSSFSNKRNIKICHSDDDQKFYNDFIIEHLSNIISSVYNYVSQSNSNMRSITTYAFPEIEDLYNELKSSGKKRVTKKYLDRLSPLALAAWYMDDGSIIHHNQPGRQDRCSLHCQGFGTQNVKLIADWFNSRGYDCNLVYENEEFGTEIRFTVDGAGAFLNTIAPYVIPQFNYKLPEVLRKIEKIQWWKHQINGYDQSLIEANVERVDKNYKVKEEWLKYKYDIQVEDNHNYFANNILVHNSNIQKGIAISGLPNMWVLFALKVDDVYKDFSQYPHLKMEEHRIFNIYQFENYTVDVDFNHPEIAQNKIVELTLKVEEQCPVGKHFGKTGIGEGIVFECITDDSRYIFKSKGEKHSVSKVKTVASVDIEAIESMQEFVDYAVTENRMKQGIDKMIEMGIPLEMKSTGEYLRWVYNDVIKEEVDTIVKNQIDLKKIGSFISTKARIYWQKHLNDLAFGKE